MVAVMPNWLMYLAIFIFATFFGKSILASVIYFIGMCKGGVLDFVGNPKKYINDKTIHDFFN